MYLYYQHLGRNSKGENESLSMLSVVESHKWFLFNVFCFLENKKELSFKIWLKSKFLILNRYFCLPKHKIILFAIETYKKIIMTMHLYIYLFQINSMFYFLL
jgi:hypothetical protein